MVTAEAVGQRINEPLDRGHEPVRAADVLGQDHVAAGAEHSLGLAGGVRGLIGATVPSVAGGSAFVYEVILTALLMFVIMAVATDTRAVGPAAAIAINARTRTTCETRVR